MARRCWPFAEGRQVYSGFGYRSGEYAGMHYGVDFGREGGSGGNPVYAAQAGTVVQTGAASGFGGPAPRGGYVWTTPTMKVVGILSMGT